MNWDQYFAQAYETSWPVPCVSMAGAIYLRDKKAVKAAAKKHGYVLTDNRKKYVAFLKRADAK